MEIIDAISFLFIPGVYIGFLLGRLDIGARIELARAEGHNDGIKLLWPFVVRYCVAELLGAHQRPGDVAGDKAAGGEGGINPPLH